MTLDKCDQKWAKYIQEPGNGKQRNSVCPMAIFRYQNNNMALYQFLEKYCNHKIIAVLVIENGKNASYGVLLVHKFAIL
jgi:hypothetical protein